LYLFGQGFRDVFRAQQLRRGTAAATKQRELPPAQVLVADIVTEATTRDLTETQVRRTTGPTRSR
jgi:hypothetical protein